MGLFSDMRDRGVWTSYDRYVVSLEPLLERASQRGSPVSPARHAEVSALLATKRDELFAQMQTIVPDEAKPLVVCKRKPSYRKPFKPSNKALIVYMRLRGHTVPRHWRTEKETTEQDELRRLSRSTHDPLYAIVLEYRDAQTMLTNHIKNWEPCHALAKHQSKEEK